MLTNPEFLFRVESDAKKLAASGAYRISDLELASRLSFFLWSSIPDERLLALAEHGQLTRPAVLEQEVRRMLGDRKAIDALVSDFAAQWLNLRRIDEVVVHPDFYPNFDDSLLEAFKATVAGKEHANQIPKLDADLLIARADEIIAALQGA